MPENIDLILWIVLALIVVALVIWWLVSSSRRRKVKEQQRADAAALRARAEQQQAEVQAVEDRASVVGAIADDARAEAEAKAAEAARLERLAEQEREAAESARLERERLQREADRLDPDVRTDDEGYRVDRSGRRLDADGQPQERGAFGRPGGAPGSVAAGVALGAAGSATPADRADRADRAGGPHPFTEEDDEPDLADADNPFAAQGGPTDGDEPVVETTSAGLDPAPDDTDADWVNSPVEDLDDSELAASAAEETAAEDWINGPAEGEQVPSPTDAGGSPAESAPAGVAAAATGIGPESTTDAREDEAMSNEEADWVNGPVDDVDQSEIDASAAEESGSADWINGPSDDDAVTPDRTTREGAGADAMSEQLAADPMTVEHVEVPALDDRDDFVVAGGTPTDDPGDHRGQPWSTDLTAPAGLATSAEADRTSVSGAAQEPAAPAGHGEEPDVAPRTPGQAAVDEEPHAVENPGPVQHSDDAPLLDDAAGTDEGDSDEGDTGAADVAAAAPGAEEPVEAEPAPEPAGSEVPPLDEPESAEEQSAQASSTQERRISGFDEVRDGGFGIGSAAPLEDRAQPLGHAVKGYRESNTFLAPGAAGYEDREPDVWFFNEEAARRAGFNPATD